jgi:hypothetical protein
MTPAHTTRKGGRRYRYYTCVQAQKSGSFRLFGPEIMGDKQGSLGDLAALQAGRDLRNLRNG